MNDEERQAIRERFKNLHTATRFLVFDEFYPENESPPHEDEDQAIEACIDRAIEQNRIGQLSGIIRRSQRIQDLII